nr:cytochrome P450 714B2-like [Ziziphus jujuba var. spinosa]
MENAKNAKLGPTAEGQYIVDNCKNLFLVGFEVPAVVAMWGLMLLALHPEWPACLRSEVQQVCGGDHNIIDANMLNKMKIMEMVIQEVLRLYPVVIFVSRQALEDVKGPDPHKFNPERFANGVSGACKCPHAYLPFGVGVLVCPGQSLAMVELKILFALIVSNFTLPVSPKYRHSPIYGLLLHPEHGVDLLIEPNDEDHYGSIQRWSTEPLELPTGLITRAHAKRFKEALNGHIRVVFIHQESKSFAKEELKLATILSTKGCGYEGMKEDNVKGNLVISQKHDDIAL